MKDEKYSGLKLNASLKLEKQTKCYEEDEEKVCETEHNKLTSSFRKAIIVYMEKVIRFYCENEVELQFVNNKLTTVSENEIKNIKFDIGKMNIIKQLKYIYKQHKLKFNAKCKCNCLEELYLSYGQKCIEYFNDHMYNFLTNCRLDTLKQCQKKCNKGMDTYNLTTKKIKDSTLKTLK